MKYDDCSFKLYNRLNIRDIVSLDRLRHHE
nr:MAG TPA: hypothetical protein [Caudoviricetes sp.]